MRDLEDGETLESTAVFETPFAETQGEREAATAASSSALAWGEAASPFAETIADETPQSEVDRLIDEALEELRDESFNEAVAMLAEETERDVADRFLGESTTMLAERERFADARLAEVRYEAEQYLDRLEEGLSNLDVASLADEQLDHLLEQYDAQSTSLTPAGEEFVGSLVRKARKVVKHVVKAAKVVGKIANPLIGPVLKRLRKLVNPLLKRVLTFAIGKLPPPLQPAARKLAARFASEAEDEGGDQSEMSPAIATDVEALAEQFDAALAEAMVADFSGEVQYEGEETEFDREAEGGQQLIDLAEARGLLIDKLRDAEADENLAPTVEQFVPAVLAALRLGVSLVGRPKVVSFLAGYVAQLIGKWVGPELSRPLSNAIVDTGMRLVTLEAEDSERATDAEEEAAPVALAAVVEDTIRRFAEHEDYVFEDEDLTQLAAAESFSQAVSTHFPPALVRSDLQRAPSLGGTFVARRPRGVRTYRKFSRVPTVEVTPQIADRLKTFGGSSVGASLRAAGTKLPFRARMHIYQAAPGTTLSSIGRMDRSLGGSMEAVPARSFHPLTPRAAGVLLREPALGAKVPSAFLRSPRRIAAGQRVFVLQPVGASSPVAVAGTAAAARLMPTRARLRFNYGKGSVKLSIYFSEEEAQRIADTIRKGQGTASLLRAVLQNAQSVGLATARRQVQREDEDREDLEDFVENEKGAGGVIRRMPRGVSRALKRRLAAWLLPAIAKWVKTNGEAFVRAAAHPDAGLTIRAKMTGVPGLGALRQLATGAKGAGSFSNVLSSMRGAPAITITATPGRARK